MLKGKWIRMWIDGEEIIVDDKIFRKPIEESKIYWFELEPNIKEVFSTMDRIEKDLCRSGLSKSRAFQIMAAVEPKLIKICDQERNECHGK